MHDTVKVVKMTKIYDSSHSRPVINHDYTSSYSGMISLVSVHRSLDGWQVTYSGPVVKDGPNL